MTAVLEETETETRYGTRTLKVRLHQLIQNTSAGMLSLSSG